jgi:hypothetical protein
MLEQARNKSIHNNQQLFAAKACAEQSRKEAPTKKEISVASVPLW